MGTQTQVLQGERPKPFCEPEFVAYTKTMNRLPFLQIGIKNFLLWRECALETIEILTRKKKNPAILADPGSGKTVVAVMINAALNKRAICIESTRFLAHSQTDLYKNVTGKNTVRAITGEEPEKNRIWNNLSEQLIFTTAESFLAEYDKGRINLDDFDYFIVDEAHHATGEHAYTKALKIFADTDKRILSMTNEFGTTKQQAEIVHLNCKIDAVIELTVPMPHITERTIEVKFGKDFRKINALFAEIMDGYLFELEEILDVTIEGPHLTEDQHRQLRERINKLEDLPGRGNSRIRNEAFLSAIFYHTIYRKIARAYLLLMTHCYGSFLQLVKEYADEVDKAQSSENVGKIRTCYIRTSKRLTEDPRFQKIVHLVKNRKGEHPKVAALLKEFEGFEDRALVFVGERMTALHLKEILLKNGISCELFFGGKSKSKKKDLAILESFQKKEVTVLLTTSKVDEGANLPEVKRVYRYHLPTSKSSRKQSRGRTGQISAGEFVCLVSDIPFEKGLFWKTHIRKYEKVLAYIRNGDYIPAAAGNNVISKKRKKLKVDDPRQLKLPF